MDDWNVPLYNSIKKYSKSKPIPFHMPGHKMGAGFPKGFVKNLAEIDITEIPGFDNLHHPEGIIKEAQSLAAKAFGADVTFFLVNGSTCGIQAAIMTICKPQETLIVARDCHKSVIGAMILAGVNPVYINPGFNKNFGIAVDISAREIEDAIMQNPQAVGVLITSPSYYGVCADISSIAKRVHALGKVLIIDEAHGAHLGFNRRLPNSAVKSGADICVQSAHKTLAAFTQAAYLHIKGNRIEVDRLKFNLSLLETSSPSYILMSSLDIARAVMEYRGAALLDELLDKIEQFNDKMIKLENLKVLGKNDIEGADFDLTRIVVKTRGMGITGFETEKILRDEFNIQVEMSDPYNIVCIATIADKKQAFKKLGDALAYLSVRFKGSSILADIIDKRIKIPEASIALKDIRKYEGRKVKLSEAVGKVSLDMVTPYPPGIPVLCPGEIINEDIVEYVLENITLGGMVNGLTGNMEINILK